MTRRLFRRLFSLTSATTLIAGGVALAAEAHEGPSLTTSLLLPILNFAGFVFLLYWFAWPALLSALAERRRVIEHELSEADRAQREAAAMRDEVEARRSRLAEEGERLVRALRTEAEADRVRLLETGRQSGERIRTDARLLAEQESARAGRQIRGQVAEQVIARVAAALRERLTRADEERFVKEFVSAVETGDLQ
ncbi:MAG TPA: ATP synthase F0 subunit B [Candidatus Binatia bacterium]|nr:ATP synthase F0 subunit B [Candidatus Binatia bacterium]